ncbi:MAG: hypothetical protein ACREOB_10550, partial [Thermodesulfobacteriota bacterium]
MRIFWRQFLSNFLIISLVLTLFTIFTIIQLRKHDKSLTKDRLLTTANLLSKVLKDPILGRKTEELAPFALPIDETNGIRITAIDKDGVVISDSEKDPKVMENHGGRPEVKDAISKGIGESIRYSTTVKKDMFYVAVALKGENGKIQAVVRTALPLSSFEETFAIIKFEVIYLALILILIALFLSFVSS